MKDSNNNLQTENIFASVSFSREKRNDFKTITLVIGDFDSTHRLKGATERKPPAGTVPVASEAVVTPLDSQSHSHHVDSNSANFYYFIYMNRRLPLTQTLQFTLME